MREILIDSDKRMTTDKSPEFVPLGPVDAVDLSDGARARVGRANAAPQREVWGTLGLWQDAPGARLLGTLRFSEYGEQHSRPEQSGDATCKLIDQVQLGRDAALSGVDAKRVLERFVDLSDVWPSNFAVSDSFEYERQPALRLTLFVRPGEGALVVLQHGRLGEDGVEFIQPEPTGNDHTCTARDRLDYRIPLPVDQAVRAADAKGVQLSGVPRRVPAGTSLKILTFERGNSTSAEVVRRALSALGRDKYSLMKWDATQGCFGVITPDKVRRDAKTLLLLHGTFSSTSSSFGKLVEGGAWSWLENIAIAGRRYGQVLAFDHDTVLDGLAANAEQLRTRLGGGFSQPVDLLTHSRGGLLGKYLAIYQDGLQVERAAMTACANGVGYFTAARGLSRFLTVLYQFTKSSLVGSVIVALAQHSIDAVLELPGLRVMTPNDPDLLEVAQLPIPLGRQQTVYLPVLGDYSHGLVANNGFFRRVAENGLDVLIKAFLGPRHDWVVGTSAQDLFAPGEVLAHYEPVPVPAWHTTYYDLPPVRQRIERFLLLGT